MLQRLQKAECQTVLLEHATFVLQKGCGLSKSEYVGTNRRAGPAESMTIRVLTEVLEIGERITNILNAHDLSSYQACLFPTQSVVTTPVFSKFVSRLRTVEIFDKIRF